MSETTRWLCPAKLNLFLHINGRRADGYHLLQTVFQLLDWGDELEVSLRDDGKIVRRIDIPGVDPAEDLSIRAAMMLQSVSGVSCGADIGLHKRIPQGSGLGGSSTDAATTLLALNHLWKCGLSLQSLADIGLQLGADVPVFVRGNSAWAEGIGEHLQPVNLGERWYVLVFADQAMSTESVFGHRELPRETPLLNPAMFAPDWRFEMLGNDCQNVVCSAFPALGSMCASLSEHGHPRMTGTGSTFFFALESEIHANQLTIALKNNYNVRAVRGVDRSPVFDQLPAQIANG